MLFNQKRSACIATDAVSILNSHFS